MIPFNRHSRYRSVWLILCVGTCLTTIAATVAWYQERQDKITRFQYRIDTLTAALQQQIDINLEILQATSNLFSSSEGVSREEFRVFVAPFLARYPSVSALDWSDRVFQGERDAYEQRIRAEGFPTFEITERGAEGEMVRAGDRRIYYPITYVEPFSVHADALGYDFGSHPVRRSALEAAIATGQATTSGRIVLITTKQIGVLIFQPVYRRDINVSSVYGRQEHLLGTVVAAYEVADMVEVAIEDMELENIQFYLFDTIGEQEERFLAFYQANEEKLIVDPGYQANIQVGFGSICADQAHCSRPLQVGDRLWMLTVLPEFEALGLKGHGVAITILLSGFLLTGSLANYVRLSLKHTIQVEALVQERTQQAEQLQETLSELKQTQAQLIQTEKMSSLGQLVAGVAHEINNPVNFIHGNLSHTSDYVQDLLKMIQLYQHHYPNPPLEIVDYAEEIDLEFLTMDLAKILSSMATGTDRIRQIVLSLRNFSRFDQAEIKSVNLHDGIDSTLMILQNRLKAKPGRPAIAVIKDYGNIPPVECYAGQLNQVFMNLISNAVDALDEAFTVHSLEAELAQQSDRPADETDDSLKPTIHIQTRMASDNWVQIAIADNGKGISDAAKQKLFEPFFTTKPIGKGTGLGLSISYQIVVDKHGGRLHCHSTPAKGTTFHIDIPLQQPIAQTPSKLKIVSKT